MHPIPIAYGSGWYAKHIGIFMFVLDANKSTRVFIPKRLKQPSNFLGSNIHSMSSWCSDLDSLSAWTLSIPGIWAAVTKLFVSLAHSQISARLLTGICSVYLQFKPLLCCQWIPLFENFVIFIRESSPKYIAINSFTLMWRTNSLSNHKSPSRQ